MKRFLKRGLSLVLAMVMVIGLLPITAFGAVDASGKPTDLKNTLVLSIYTPEGSFPGEPAMHDSADYESFNSKFEITSASGKFKDNATSELDPAILNDLVQGASNGKNTVWGIFSADGLDKYFLNNASITNEDNEVKIIKAIKGNAVKNMTKQQILDKYEIIWYVIKLQHSPGNYWWSSSTTEWHIDGLIREKIDKTITINYYGNGNTEGSAPDGVTNHIAGNEYTVLGSTNMKKKINGVYVDFLGWSAKADGTGDEAGFYQPGDVIKPTQSISLYAMWDTFTQYTATVNTYLDGVLTDSEDIHEAAKSLHLSTDEEHYYALTRDSEGVYTVKITGNGKFQLYHKTTDGGYSQIGTHQLTIYNQNATLDVHHYSVTYDPNGGEFAENPGKQNYLEDETVMAVATAPIKEGYRFLGWKDNNGKLIQAGEVVTDSITAPITLTAQWEKTVNVTIHVTVNHKGGNGYDQMETKDDVFLALVSRENSQSPYLETGDTLTLNDTTHQGFTYQEKENVTVYAAEGFTYTDMPGGEAAYTVVTSKSGYDTTITPKQDADGNWIIDVVMTYNPSNFDLEFTVEVDENVPEQYIPDAAIVKVTFWSTDRNQWEIITQQEGNLPGVRVDIDPNTRSGSGSYPVWKYESNGTTPYGYRVEVTSFVYPDGTIVAASQVVTQNVAWSDNVYTATMSDVTGGKNFGTLKGAYIGATKQEGKLETVITMDLHDVTFDAQGGKVNGMAYQTVEDQYKIPAFKGYVPTREGGYTFGGWYEDEACTKAATEGVDLTKDITLYAKWIEPLTISGTIYIAGSYKQNGVDVPVNDIDRAAEAVVVLQEIRNGNTYDVDSKTITFHYEGNNAEADYNFTGIPNNGKNYRIQVLELNYGTAYDNESDADSDFTANEFAAVFAGDGVADVDAELTFVPPSYDQPMRVDATQIGENFRPKNVLAEVMYRDTGDNHPFKRISQHNVEPYGVQIWLPGGIGTGTQSIWKWHTDGMLYDYQMNISKVDGDVSNSDTAPYYIVYDAPAYWNGNTGKPSGELKATLIPKQYLITFDLNAGTDTVTGMDSFQLTYENEEGNTVAADTYGVIHTWSFDTAITAVPQRDGHTFKGWTANADGVYVDGKIPADVHQEVILTAQWEKNKYQVTTAADPEAGGTTVGDGTYLYGEQVTVTATLNTGYYFCGWYEGDALVSEDMEYTFTIDANRNLTAQFARNPYDVVANTTVGGTTVGTGTYEYGQTATVTATPSEGYAFRGWFEGLQKVSEEASYSFTVTADRTLTAQFSKVYTITANAETGGSVSGGGAFEPMTKATITAKANGGYYFVGWYDEKGELVTAETSYTLTVKEDRTFTARFEQKVAYRCDYVYIFGYNNSEIGATGSLLRGELAQMIYRLVKQNQGVSNGGYTFSDTAGKWFQSGISYMASKGAIDASRSRANPYASVTRGETYKMICLGLGFTSDTELSFSEYATILRNSGYLADDGRVTAKIQRWEFCQLFNAILGRSGYCADGFFDVYGNEVTAESYGYTDLKPEDSYYRIMMIATSTFTNGKIDLEKRIERNTYDYNN